MRATRTLSLVTAAFVGGLAMILLVRADHTRVADYYIDSSSPRASDKEGGTRATPWKSLARLAKQTLVAGDSVYFARGSSYTGGVIVEAAGTAAAPIRFSAYGEGDAPRFTNPDYRVLAGAVFRIKGSHLRFEDLYFHSTANLPHNQRHPIQPIGAVFIEPSAHHITIDTCEFTDTPVGIHTYGRHIEITRNRLHYDSKRHLSFPDWGPIAIFVGGQHTQIAYNRITDFISLGGNWGGADGGAMEIDAGAYQKITGRGAENILVHHNYSSGNAGFIEQTEYAIGIVVSHNVSDDYKNFLAFWQAQPAIIEHNTIIRTRPKNANIDVVFGLPKPGNLIRNNIIVVRKGIEAFPDCETKPQSSPLAQCAVKAPWHADQNRSNNLYFSVDGTDPVGRVLAAGEKVADPGFLNFERRDLRLSPASSAIDMGLALDSVPDFDRRPVPVGAAPDAGAYEFQGTRATGVSPTTATPISLRTSSKTSSRP